MILWNVFPNRVKREQLQVVNMPEFELNVEFGQQRPLFYLKEFCPICRDYVYINRLFPNCVFCDYDFGIHWEFAWINCKNKISALIVAGHEVKPDPKDE